MAQNFGTFLLVILSSWAPCQPSEGGPEFLYIKSNLFLTNCCHSESAHKSQKQCRCLTTLENGDRLKDNFSHANLSRAEKRTSPSKIQKSNNQQHTLEFLKKLNRDIELEISYSKATRNNTLNSIFQWLSLVLSRKERKRSIKPQTSSYGTEEWLQPSSVHKSPLPNSIPRPSVAYTFTKRTWGGSHDQNVFVFGKDDRKQILPPLLRKFPYSSIVRLSTGCTGTLVTPFHVLTAAHCVHNGREFRNKLEMMKVEIPDTIGIRVYYIEKISIPNHWLNPRSRNYQQASYDYAVVRLSYGVHGRYEFLPLSIPTKATLHHNLQFLGFPNYGFGLWRSVCPARTTKSLLDGNLILARCDSAFGNSGAAIFTTDFRSEKKVVGILSSTVSTGANPMLKRYSIITALTETKLLDICTELGQIGVFFGVCPSAELIPRRRGFQRKIKTIPFFG